MISIREILDEITQAFHQKEIKAPKRQAEELLCDLFSYSRLELYSQLDQPFPEEMHVVCQAWVQRRLKGEPLAYICGKVHFYECEFNVTPAVLIPRQETEILVDQIVHVLQQQDLTHQVLWDVCCGSGCIGIALKKKFPALSVYLADQSAEALAVAAANARANEVEVTCLQGDLLAPFQGKKAHFIVCNPPYISEAEYDTLEKEVKDYEPYLALVGGPTGLEFYERLAHDLPAHLHAGGNVWLEIGYQQGEALQEIFSSAFWKRRLVENDWAGHSRFFFLENE